MARRWVCLEYCNKAISFCAEAAGPAEMGRAADAAQADGRKTLVQPPRYSHKQIKVTRSQDEVIILQRHSWVGNHPRSYQQLAIEPKGLFQGWGRRDCPRPG